jgi:hypothetical protein
MFPSPDDDNEILFDKFSHYEESKLLDKIEDDLYPEYNPEIMRIIDDRKAYRRMVLETTYNVNHFSKFKFNYKG